MQFLTWNNSPTSEVQKTAKTVFFGFFLPPLLLVYYLVVFCGEAQSCAVTLAMVRWMEPCLAINHCLVNPWASEYKVTWASGESATQGSSRFWLICLAFGSLLKPRWCPALQEAEQHVVHVPCVLLQVTVNEAAAVQNKDMHEVSGLMRCVFYG